MKTNKRLKSAWIALLLNMALLGLGVIKEADITDLGTGLMLVNAPILVYILGESFRPSIKKEENV